MKKSARDEITKALQDLIAKHSYADVSDCFDEIEDEDDDEDDEDSEDEPDDEAAE